MAQPGWFPDPDGTPGRLRYWDGTTWTQHVMGAPGQPAASPATGPGRESPGVGPRRDRRRLGLGLGAGALALLLILLAAFVLPRFFGGLGDAGGPVDSSSPTISSWDERATPTPPTPPTPPPTRPTPTPPPSSASKPTPCPTDSRPVVNGRLYGGRLSVPVVPDSRWFERGVRELAWAVCANGIEKTIKPDVWISEVLLAGIQPGSMTADLESQAQQIYDDSEEPFYALGVTGRKTLVNEALTVDGHPAWHLRVEVRVNNYGPDIPGDVLDLVVVDHGDGVRSALITVATIGDTRTQAQVDACRAALRVER